MTSPHSGDEEDEGMMQSPLLAATTTGSALSTPSTSSSSDSSTCHCRTPLSIRTANELGSLQRRAPLSLVAATPTSPEQPLGKRRLFGKRRSRRLSTFLVALTVFSMCATFFFTLFLVTQQDYHHGGVASNTEEWRIQHPSLYPQPITGSNLPARPPKIRSKSNKASTTNHDKVKASPTKSIRHDGAFSPRVMFLEQNNFPKHHSHRYLHRDPMLSAPIGEEAAPQLPDNDDKDDGCIPMADWQTQSFPNCNVIHELDLQSAGPNVGKHHSKVSFEHLLYLLGRGWFRHTWQLDSQQDSVVLKTLRLERDFMEEYYELHRRDAVAMERLTHSPFVMDVYGYCGQSAINELADFPNGLSSLEKFDRNLRGRSGADIQMLKLQVAASIAVGLAHIHGIDERPSMVHYDLNPRNVAITKGGKPKLNDFNIAEFLRINPQTNETCGFSARMHDPWWRAPEEVALGSSNTTVDEKVDVYALGSVLFHVLTTHSPRGKMKKERAEEVRRHVLRGDHPAIPAPYNKSSDKVSKVFRQVMKMCFEKDPDKRATSHAVAELLMEAMKELKARH